ncbi:MAG TPA: helix-turn-helix transcriptional regulator [Terracidiphilus sp.]
MEQDRRYPGTSTPTLTSMPEMGDYSRRRELADFLRARREGLSPERIGLPLTRRRRVPGLRREEVAEAAGISTAWYTYIEQARDLNLSPATLGRIGLALHLNGEERDHLFQLAGHAAPLQEDQGVTMVMTPLLGMLRGMEPNPAYALDPKWNIVAWNRASETIFGDLESVHPAERNYLNLIFTSSVLRERFVNWEDVARCSIAHFRTDSAAHVNDPEWMRMVDELRARSGFFRDWWPKHNVAWPHTWRKELRTPGGNRIFHSFDMELSKPARLRIVTYIPSPV